MPSLTITSNNNSNALLNDFTLSTATCLHQQINDALVVQKQHQLKYIYEQQRLQQEKQRQLLYTQEQRRLQYLRCSNQLPWPNQAAGSMGTHSSSQALRPPRQQPLDLVDDVWRLVAYILARDCKDLGRLMQVNRRLHELTVSGSIFSSQKPLVSPTWIRGESNRAGSELYGSLGATEDSPATQRCPHQPQVACGSDLHSQIRQQDAIDTDQSLQQSRPNLYISTGLQMPSALVLPHHRRIVQNAIASQAGAPSRSTTMTPSSSATSIHQQQSGIQLANSYITNMMQESPTVAAATPHSTPMGHTPSTFQSNIPDVVSQVISSSTIPLTVVQNLVPSTTLKHHPPAVYWKHQVVEWLEQEKLRCLRLGLFWGFSLDSSRTHGRKPRR
ncbi:hypothetical protein BGZ94_002960 [Podila epigama]|nr:hypothetical protein BGZ94_002960 [Podila epigama]